MAKKAINGRKVRSTKNLLAGDTLYEIEHDFNAKPVKVSVRSRKVYAVYSNLLRLDWPSGARYARCNFDHKDKPLGKELFLHPADLFEAKVTDYEEAVERAMAFIPQAERLKKPDSEKTLKEKAQTLATEVPRLVVGQKVWWTEVDKEGRLTLRETEVVSTQHYRNEMKDEILGKSDFQALGYVVNSRFWLSLNDALNCFIEDFLNEVNGAESQLAILEAWWYSEGTEYLDDFLLEEEQKAVTE